MHLYIFYSLITFHDLIYLKSNIWETSSSEKFITVKIDFTVKSILTQRLTLSVLKESPAGGRTFPSGASASDLMKERK